MNDPDEELESNVPEEPLPERDDLPEALVDQESEPAPRRRISKTLIAACMLTGFGVWQIVHVSNGGEPIFRVAAKAKAAPTKVRSDGRRPIGKVLPSTDPIASYLERAKRGMTDQEIRWMVADFQAVGLDESLRNLHIEAFARSHRAKQNAWYLAALKDALNLSPQQIAAARERLDDLLERDLEVYMDMVHKPENKGMIDVDTEMDYERPRRWLKDEAYAPWNLCDLSNEQNHITMYRWRSKDPKLSLKHQSLEPKSAPALPSWMQLVKTKQDPSTGNIVELDHEGSYNFGWGTVELNLDGRILLIDVFPLTPDQEFKFSFSGVDQARCLHPSQLRMAMLMDRDTASSLLSQLDKRPPATNPGIIIEKPEAPVSSPTSPTDELPPNTVDPETPVDPLLEPDSK